MRSFRLLWFGEGASLLGGATSATLLPLLAVRELHAGPAWMGALTAATWLPWLVLGLPAGSWIDRHDPRRVMLVTDLLAAAVVVSIPVAWFLDLLTLPQLFVVALLGGTGQVFLRTALVKLLPTTVPDERLDTANSRFFGTESSSQVLGPALAGRLAAAVGAAGGLLIDAVSYAVSAICLWRMPSAPPSPRRAEPGGVREGIAFVLGDPAMRWFTLIGSLSNLGLTGYGALLVLHLVQDLGASDAEVGTYLMAGGIGGILASLVVTRITRRIGNGRAATLFLLAAPCALLVGADDLRVSGIGCASVAFAVVGGNVIRGTWRQRYVPAHLLGRVATTVSTVNYGTMPLAGLLAGWLGTTLGVRPTVLVMAGVHVLACWLVLISPLARLRELPTRPSSVPAQPVPVNSAAPRRP